MFTDNGSALVNGNGNGKVKEIRKRDGRTEPFDAAKIAAAVRKCFLDGLGRPEKEGDNAAWDVTRRVSNILKRRQDTVTVEDIQRLVIQQLWASEQFDAAEHYTIYREQHRQERLKRGASPEEATRIAEDAYHFPLPSQYYQFISKFARWNEEKKRRETWREAVDRVMSFFHRQEQIQLTLEEWAELEQNFFDLKATPAMRVLQMAGPALDRCHVGAYNCSYLPISDLKSFAELLYILMQGTGCGFSVESDYVERLPRIKRQKKGAEKKKFVIPDDTEGWCEALLTGLEAWYSGHDVDYDASLVRKQGARLKTKGGRASGPEPLLGLLNFVRKKILARQGKRLRDIDCHDICCMIGKIVQVGGVRRASEISLSDLDSTPMRDAKMGNWWDLTPWRDMANNSAVYDTKPTAIEFMEEWLALAKSGSGERGIFNRRGVYATIPRRRKRVRFGVNPCVEIILRPYGFCNLTIAVARPDDTRETLLRKVRLAAYWGTMQATLTNFKYLREEWKKNAEEERLLGVDVTGHMDCPLLRPGAPGRDELMLELKAEVAQVNEMLTTRWGINRSAADTCIKPSGDSSQLFFCGSGLHTWYAEFFIRRFRASVNDPVTHLLQAEGVPCNVDPMNDGLVVFDFPMKAPEGAPTRNDLTAIEQLENWLSWKKNYAEHSVSATIYVDSHEWLAVGHWVYEHFDQITGLSFLPKDNGSYQLAPYQEVTEEEYKCLVQSFPDIAWSKLKRYELEDMTTSSMEYACTADMCSRF